MPVPSWLAPSPGAKKRISVVDFSPKDREERERKMGKHEKSVVPFPNKERYTCGKSVF